MRAARSVSTSRARVRRTPRVVVGDDAVRSLLGGSRLMARALMPLVGEGGAALAALPGRAGAERLDRGGLLARRLIEVGDPLQNMGAMVVRHAACRVEDACGDGAALTAVLTDALIQRMARLVVAGYEPHTLIPALQGIAERVMQAVERDFVQPCDPCAIEQLVLRLVRDPELASTIAQAVVSVGADGFVEVVRSPAASPRLDRIEGVRWPVTGTSCGARPRVDWPQTHVAVVSDPITTTDELRPLLEQVRHSSVTRLVLAARSTSPAVDAWLVANSERGGLPLLAAVRLGDLGDFDDELEDIATYAGTEVVSRVSGRPISHLKRADLGVVRRAQISDRHLKLVAGGDPSPSLARASALRRRAASAPDCASTLRHRAARLEGLVAEVGAPSGGMTERHVLAAAQDAATLGLAALEDGVVRPASAALYLGGLRADAASDVDGAIAQAFLAALAAPVASVLERQGLDAAVALDRMAAESVRPSWEPEAGDVLPLRVLRASLDVAVSAAGSVLCASVLVRGRVPERRLDP